MHVHGASSMCMLAPTSIGPSQQGAARMETLPASAAAAPGMLAVDWLPLVAEVARIEPPARVGVGGESVIGVQVAVLNGSLRQRHISLYACGDAVRGWTQAGDGADVRLE